MLRKRRIKIAPKTTVKKRRVKINPVAGLYNRLHRDSGYEDGYLEVLSILELKPTTDVNTLLLRLHNRINIAMHLSHGKFVVKATYQDGSGYVASITPPLYAIKSSSSLARAAILAYIELCNKTGKLI